MISWKIFFQLMVTFFKEKLKLYLPLIFDSSIRFVFETVFISKYIAENRWKISKSYYMALKTLAR